MATYTEITREGFEDWLLGLCPVAERVQGKQGVYAIPVSNDVHLYISTSLGRDGVVVAKGQGACHMKLQGRTNGRCLNRKDLGQTRFNRTTGWSSNWAKGIERMFAAYNKYADFYDCLGRETQAEYATRVIGAIEVQPNPNSDFFWSLKNRVLDGYWLSPKQEEAVFKTAPTSEDELRAQKNEVVDNYLQNKKIEAVKALRDAAKSGNDEWTFYFTISILKLLNSNLSPTPRQVATLEKLLESYNIENPLAA